LGILRNLEIKYTRKGAYVICKYYTMLSKELEHQWNLTFVGVWNQSPTNTKEKLYFTRDYGEARFTAQNTAHLEIRRDEDWPVCLAASSMDS
jgi:hypothetical protein